MSVSCVLGYIEELIYTYSFPPARFWDAQVPYSTTYHQGERGVQLKWSSGWKISAVGTDVTQVSSEIFFNRYLLVAA